LFFAILWQDPFITITYLKFRLMVKDTPAEEAGPEMALSCDPVPAGLEGIKFAARSSLGFEARPGCSTRLLPPALTRTFCPLFPLKLTVPSFT
jgi:hypothetical protein